MLLALVIHETMFYNNDILARRKGGLSVVWLAATIGRQSPFRKLSRREIMSVNIPKTCATVASPPEPMALRLSSQLMFGVVRIYGQQAEAWFSDVHSTHVYIRKLITDIRIAAAKPGTKESLDMAVRAARPETITLTFDEVFYDIGFDPLLTWSPERYELVKEPSAGLSSATFAPSPIPSPRPPRFIAPRERITLPTPFFEELEEPGLARAAAEERAAREAEIEEVDLGLELEAEGVIPPCVPFLEEAIPAPEVAMPSEVSYELGPPEEIDEMPLLPEEEMPEVGLEIPEEAPPPVSPETRERLRREREELEEIELAARGVILPPEVPAIRPTKRARLVPEDTILELTDEEIRASRRDYAEAMHLQRAEIILRERASEDARTARGLLLGPPRDIADSPLLVELWSLTVGARFKEIRDNFEALKRRRVEPEEPPGALPPPPSLPEVPEEEYELPPLIEPESPPPLEEEVGIARAAEEVSRQLPWNIYVELTRREELPEAERSRLSEAFRSFSITGTPTRLRARAAMRESLTISSPRIGAREESFVARAEEITMEAPEGFELAPLTEREREAAEEEAARIAELDLERETRNFLEYARGISRELHEDVIFFSDLAPVASSSPSIAAQAFYHVLTLATNDQIRVRQDEAYGEIQISFKF
ncbi:hypothetical protein IE53DRAFT_233763 [Violaceomyces palustris]|uniref:Uncharacterized protein n=1 Tax=Violaceomyces palustris TaxID=1673888 RepID=A0ACD0NPF8_9BASI|nr:hypothetical protein IE53DRAFT_233763 [Violaceomyces palustris]